MTTRQISIKGKQLRFLAHADSSEQLVTGTATGETPTGWNLKVKGTDIYWVDDDGAERYKTGTLTGDSRDAGDIIVHGEYIYYGDINGAERYVSAITIGVIDSLEFDTTLARHSRIINISGDVYAIVYSGGAGSLVSTGYGWLKTVSISSDGTIGSIIDTFNFDSASCYPAADIIQVSGNVYAIVYHKTNSGGWVITVQIDTDGSIAEPVIDSLQLFSRPAGTHDTVPFIIHAAGDTFIILSTNSSNAEGYLYTVSIDSSGNIGAAVIDSWHYDSAAGYYPEIIKVSGTTYAIACTGHWVKTLTIADNGTIAKSIIDSLDYSPTVSDNAYGQTIINISGDYYAVAHNGVDGDGWLFTMTIDSSGNISNAVIDSFEFDTSAGTWPHIIELSANYFAIGYTTSGTDGKLVTIEIDNTGDIAASATYTLEFDTYNGEFVTLILIDIDTQCLAAVYSGFGSDGWLKTIGFEIP